MSKRRADKNVVPFYNKPPLQAKNAMQKRYINAIRNSTIVVGTGVAGSGKTYIAATIAADMLEDSRSSIERIIIARPNEIEGTKSIGFLKGTANDKMAPLVAPVADTLKKRLGVKHYEYLLEKGTIELLPLEYIKGRSFDNTFVIIDEAEDLEWSILKTLMLRTGKDCKVVIDGDVRQTSISKESGLQKLLDLEKEYHLPVQFVDFDSWDYCVRSDECRIFGQIFEDAGI
jgi:phosphate starvation-inducible PhoH-like protein